MRRIGPFLRAGAGAGASIPSRRRRRLPWALAAYENCVHMRSAIAARNAVVALQLVRGCRGNQCRCIAFHEALGANCPSIYACEDERPPQQMPAAFAAP
jgi:hypothetical protein